MLLLIWGPLPLGIVTHSPHLYGGVGALLYYTYRQSPSAYPLNVRVDQIGLLLFLRCIFAFPRQLWVNINCIKERKRKKLFPSHISYCNFTMQRYALTRRGKIDFLLFHIPLQPSNLMT
jgi:hypothetical protein